MTVFSTVGYGSHSYDQTEEYIVATIFILFAAFFSVLPYYTSRKYGMLLYDSYKEMQQAKDMAIMNWMRKIQV